jgi:protein-disulfide isomerase
MTSNTPRPTRSEQREAARAKAKALREQQQRGDKRKRIFIQLGVAASVIVAVGSVALVISSDSSEPIPASTAIPTNAIFNDGVKVGVDLKLFTPSFTPVAPTGEEPIEIVIYLDYQCVFCKDFELANGEQLKSWVSKGAATVQLHALASKNAQAYSSRAANASMCLAEYSPDSFFAYHNLLLQAQPSAPRNAELIKIAEELGATNMEKVSSCITSREFGNWLDESSVRILTQPFPGTDIRIVGTPTTFVNGVKYPGDITSPDIFAQFVALVASGELN